MGKFNKLGKKEKGCRRGGEINEENAQLNRKTVKCDSDVPHKSIQGCVWKIYSMWLCVCTVFSECVLIHLLVCVALVSSLCHIL